MRPSTSSAVREWARVDPVGLGSGGAVPAGPTRAHSRTADDVEGRIAALERRRARTRSRRWFAAWVVLVAAATTVSGVIGWGAGLPG